MISKPGKSDLFELNDNRGILVIIMASLALIMVFFPPFLLPPFMVLGNKISITISLPDLGGLLHVFQDRISYHFIGAGLDYLHLIHLPTLIFQFILLGLTGFIIWIFLAEQRPAYKGRPPLRRPKRVRRY